MEGRIEFNTHHPYSEERSPCPQAYGHLSQTKAGCLLNLQGLHGGT